MPPARVELVVADESGRLSVVFFNQTWRARQLPVGTLALLFGTVGSFRGALQMVSPVVDVLRSADDRDEVDEPRTGRIFPVYPLSERANLTSARISRFVHEALDRAGALADPLTDGRRQSLGMVDRTVAFNDIHRPTAMAAVEPARRRLAFDELLRLQLALVLRQHRLQADSRGIRHVIARADGAPTVADRFVERLPFALTGAQQRAIETIGRDLARPLPMHRLLQGDVGSGKTVVAVWAMLVAVEEGRQGALMAPTEVLAEQHATQVRALLRDLEVVDDRTLAGTRPLRRRAPHQPDDRDGTNVDRGRVGRWVGRPGDRHPCTAHRGRDLPVVGRRRHRRAAPVRSRAASPAPGQGRARASRRRSRPLGHDGHSHSPDGGHGRLRRPRHDGGR